MTGPQLRSLACPNCGAPVNVRAVGITLTVVCGNCGSSLDAADPDLAILQKGFAARSRARIPLGTRGWLAAIEWEAIGYLERSGGGGSWDETLLFNPWAGYRFLVHAEDEWRLGTALDVVPADDGREVILEGNRFWVGDGYDATVDFVVGEFYWRVATGELVGAIDYADASGVSLSREANGSEVSWTRLELQGEGVVESAFGLEPPAEAASEPFFGPRKQPWAITFIAVVATVILLLVRAWGATEERVIDIDMMPEIDGPILTETIGVVTLQRWRSVVSVTSGANIDNKWVDLDIALVNRATQQRFEAYSIVESYSGRDSEGYWWAEGDANPTIHFASMPRGTYDVIVEAGAHSWPARTSWEPPPENAEPPTPVNIKVIRNAQTTDTLVLALLLIWLLPGWQWLTYKIAEEMA